MLIDQRRFLVMLAVLAGFCAAGCAEGETQEGGGTPNMGGSGGTGGDGTGGSAPLCAEDCSLVDTPDCFTAVCNDGAHPGAVGTCVVVVDDAGTCDDGLFCTTNDSCSAGTCAGGPANTCGLDAQPCQIVTCNEGAQMCEYAADVNGANCTPTDLCEVGGTCTNGLCVGVPLDCTFSPLSECNVTTCNSANGQCEGTPDTTKNGDPCTQSGLLCQINKTCDNGVCQGGTPKDCSALTMNCTNGVCNANNGFCEGVTVMAGQACLAAADDCNTGICNNNGGCDPVPANNGMPCSDFSSCTTGDLCAAGACTGTPVSNCVTYFEDGFEQACPPPGWTLTGDWECGAPMYGPSNPVSGVNVIATKLNTDYSSNQSFLTTNAQTPPIDLTGTTNPTLSFRAWYNTEEGYDGFNVKVSTDGGASFSVVQSVTPAYNDVTSEDVWAGEGYVMGGYQLLTADLSAHVGQQIILRFSFESDGSIEYEGVYIDDVTVSEPEAVPVVITTAKIAAAFENTAYTQPLAHIGGTSNVTWSIVGGTNHSWLSIDPATGTLSGTPGTGNLGPVAVTVRASEPSVPTNFTDVTFNTDVLHLYYGANFDGGCPAGWTLGGDWECGTPTYPGGPTCFSGSNCLATSLAGDYNSSQSFLTCNASSIAVNLAGATIPALFFQAYLYTESGYDGFNVKVSTDGGVTWAVQQVVDPPYNDFLSEDVWAGEYWFDGWQPYQVSLAAYAGMSILVRFSFESDGSFEYDGVYIDDVVIAE